MSLSAASRFQSAQNFSFTLDGVTTPLALVNAEPAQDGGAQRFKPYTPAKWSASATYRNRFAVASTPTQVTALGGDIFTAPAGRPLELNNVPMMIMIMHDRMQLGVCRLDSETCQQFPASSTQRRMCLESPACRTKCTRMGGAYNDAAKECTVSYYANKICVVVAQNARGEWVLNGTQSQPYGSALLQSGAIGCYAESEMNPPGIPAFFPASYTSSMPSTITLEIRHVRDPLLVASRITRGTYSFGPSMEDDSGSAGTGLIIIGAILCISAVVMLISKRVKAKSQPQHVPVILNSSSTYPNQLSPSQPSPYASPSAYAPHTNQPVYAQPTTMQPVMVVQQPGGQQVFMHQPVYAQSPASQPLYMQPVLQTQQQPQPVFIQSPATQPAAYYAQPPEYSLK